MDDPTPFFHDGKYYVLTRTFARSILHIRVFDSHFKELESYILDLKSIVDGYSFNVNSLVKIENEIFLITSIHNDPPHKVHSKAYIVGIRLHNNLKKAHPNRIDLTKGTDYEIYVSSAKYRKGKLYIVHDVITDLNGGHRGILRVYDTKDNFKLIKSIVINEGKMIDNHITIELLDNMLYVFYNTPDERIKVKMFSESQLSS